MSYSSFVSVTSKKSLQLIGGWCWWSARTDTVTCYSWGSMNWRMWMSRLVQFWDKQTEWTDWWTDTCIWCGHEPVDMDVWVGAVLGEADRQTLACNGAMDCRWWMSRLVEYQDTYTHRHSLVHDGAMDCRWWMSRLVEYQDTYTHRHSLVHDGAMDCRCLGWWSTGTHIHTETLTCTWWGHGLQMVDV